MKKLIYILAMLLTVNSYAQKTERQVDNSIRADNYYTPTDTMAKLSDLRAAISQDSIISKSTVTNVAITGSSETNYGIVGNSISGDGINGNSTDGVGIYGISTNNDAIYGLSTNGNGVFGVTNSNSNAGGYFYAYNGIGIKAISQSNTIAVFTNNTNDSITINSTGIKQYTNGVEVFKTTATGQIKVSQISAALTDNTPTDAEIDTATGLTPATAGVGYQVTIKDNDGSGLLYKIESDGSGWYYTVMTLAL